MIETTKLRLIRLMETPFHVFSEDAFDDPRNDALILAPMPDMAKFIKDREKAHKGKQDAPTELKWLYEEPLLNREQEYHLFRQFNYFKHKALKGLQQADVLSPDKALVENIEKNLAYARNVKRQLACSNVRLVMNISKKQKEFIQNPNIDLLADLVGDGNTGMLRAIEFFDYRMGNKFSTYATWAILHTIQGGRKNRLKHDLNSVNGYEDALAMTVDNSEPDQAPEEVAIVHKAVEELEDRQRKIIVESYGLDGKPKRTLEQIGQVLGITKERVRQIRQKGVEALREKLAHVAN